MPLHSIPLRFALASAALLIAPSALAQSAGGKAGQTQILDDLIRPCQPGEQAAILDDTIKPGGDAAILDNTVKPGGTTAILDNTFKPKAKPTVRNPRGNASLLDDTVRPANSKCRPVPVTQPVVPKP